MDKTLLISALLVITLLFVQCKHEPLTIKETVSNLSDYKSENGKIRLTINGGKTPYTINWSNNSNDTIISNLSAGIYSFTVTDAKNNILSDTIEITQPQWPKCIDKDGNSYKTAIIGGSTWMMENLRSTKTANNKDIESFIYKNNKEYIKKYGRLYTWNTAMNNSTIEGSQGVCPNGWHIPSDDEWEYLVDNVSDTNKKILNIKETLNLSYAGFYNGEFQNIDLSASFWTSTKSSNNAYKRHFHKDLSKTFRYHEKISNAISVRCVKN